MNRLLFCSQIVCTLSILLCAFGCSEHHASSSAGGSASSTCTDTFSGTIQFGVAHQNVYAYASTVDTSCNFFVSGFTNTGLDGNSLSGSTDLFVKKYDSTGTRLWTRMLGSTPGHIVYINAMTADSEGAVYLTGLTDGNVSGISLIGTQDTILVKYDKDGILKWTRLLGVSGADTFGYAIAVDSSDNVYVTGQTWGNLDSNTLTGSDDAFLVKYDTNGTKIWTRTLGGAAASTYASGVAVGVSGAIYISGYTTANLPGNTLTGSSDTFLAKYDQNGIREGVTQYGQAASVTNAWGLGIDSNENLYVAGITTGNLQGTLVGTQDLFIAKFDSNRSRIWTRQLGATGAGVLMDFDSCSVDAGGNVYVGGQVDRGLDGNSAIGTLDTFVTKYDGDGNRSWTRQFGATGHLSRVMSLSVNPYGSIFLSGVTEGNFNGKSLTGDSDGIAFALTSSGQLK